MYAIIAFIPIIVTIIVMAGFNWPAKIALPLAWLITAIVCFAAWKMISSLLPLRQSQVS